MKKSVIKVGLLIIIVFAFLLPHPQTISGQELSGGAKLVRTTPFVFAEAKFGIFAVQLGAGFNPEAEENATNGYQKSPIGISLAGKVYPIQVMGLAPYVGFSTQFSANGVYNQSRTFGGAEFSLPGDDSPLSAFAGGGLAFTEAEGAGLGWHLGIKYNF